MKKLFILCLIIILTSCKSKQEVTVKYKKMNPHFYHYPSRY